MKHSKICLFAFFIFVFGCTKNSVVLTIGAEKFTVKDFKNRVTFLPTEDSLKRTEKIDDFLNQMLVIHAARQQDYEKDPVVTTAYETNSKDIITRGYYESQVLDKIKIPDYEIKKIYEKFTDQYHLAQIVVPDESLAAHVAAQLDKGTAFDSLLEYSLDTLTKDGDIGSFPVLQLPDEILKEIKKVKVGGTTPPIQFGQYFYILKVIEHKKVETPKYEDVKESIRSSLLRERAIEQGEKFTNALIDRAQVEYNEDGFGILLKPDSLISDQDLDTWLVKKIKDKDTNYVRVRTVIDAVRYQYQRSSLDPKILVQRALLPDLLYDAAVEHNAHKFPKIKNDLARALENLLYQKFYSDSVLERVVVDSSEVRDYFKTHPADYKDKKLSDVFNLVNARVRETRIDSLRAALLARLKEKYAPVIDYDALLRL